MRAHTGRIWEAVGKDESRPILRHVYFDAENQTLSASDSFIAARVPCEVEEGDESGLIPAEALRVADGQNLRVSGGKATLTLDDGERSWRLGEGTFPDLDKVVFTNGRPAPLIVGLNAEFLARLQKALGSKSGIRLKPFGSRKPILVSANEPDSVGSIMPVVIPDAEQPAPPPDLDNDDALIAAVTAAAAQLNARRGKRRAAQAFRKALAQANESA